MTGTERRVIAEALEPFAEGLTLEGGTCSCDCEDCYFETGSVEVRSADVERLEAALRSVGYAIVEARL